MQNKVLLSVLLITICVTSLDGMNSKVDVQGNNNKTTAIQIGNLTINMPYDTDGKLNEAELIKKLKETMTEKSMIQFIKKSAGITESYKYLRETTVKTLIKKVNEENDCSELFFEMYKIPLMSRLMAKCMLAFFEEYLHKNSDHSDLNTSFENFINNSEKLVLGSQHAKFLPMAIKHIFNLIIKTYKDSAKTKLNGYPLENIEKLKKYKNKNNPDFFLNAYDEEVYNNLKNLETFFNENLLPNFITGIILLFIGDKIKYPATNKTFIVRILTGVFPVYRDFLLEELECFRYSNLDKNCFDSNHAESLKNALKEAWKA